MSDWFCNLKKTRESFFGDLKTRSVGLMSADRSRSEEGHASEDSELVRFGRDIRERRRARGWTIEEVAGRVDMDPAQFRRIETGQVAVTLTTLLRIARALVARPGELVQALGAEESGRQVLVVRDSQGLRRDRVPADVALARNMVRLRTARGLTQRDLARLAGVGASVVSTAEARRRSPTLRSLELVAEALGVTPDELLR